MENVQSNRFYAANRPSPLEHPSNFDTTHGRGLSYGHSEYASYADASEGASDLLDSEEHSPDLLPSQESRHPTQTTNYTPAEASSFAERARMRPDLALITSDRQDGPLGDQQPLSNDSPIEVSDRRYTQAPPALHRPKRTDSVPDRSPLQKLEGHLGDISKEAKRARVERAEQLAAQRAAQQEENGSSLGHMRRSSVQRKPVSGVETLPERFQTLHREDQHRRKLSEGQVSYDKEGTASPVQARRVVSGPQEQKRVISSSGPGLNRSTSGRGAYDAALTGSAAAAATQALQAARSRYRSSSYTYEENNTLSPTTSASTMASGGQHGLRSSAQQQSEQSGMRTSSQQNQQTTSTSNYSHRQGQDTQQLAGDNSLVDRAKGQQNPFDPDDVRNNGETGPEFIIPPQTLNGQQAREQVAFGHTDPNTLHDQQQQQFQEHHQSRRAHFSDILHINNRAERHYVAKDELEEWKNAATATLTAEDLDFEAKYGPSTADVTHTSEGGTTHQGPAGTSFHPPLYLRCGPLLRYTGIGTKSDLGTSRRFWRGSAMIVTQDEASSYERAPILRLYKQPANSPIPRDDAQAHEVNQFDSLTCQVKLGREGETLYVKPSQDLRHEADLSRLEDENGLFESNPLSNTYHRATSCISRTDGESLGRHRDVVGHRLYAERGVTFWRFNLEVELSNEQQRIAYRINEGPALAFWVPSKHQMMNIMFHSCNGFSHSVKTAEWCGPDPLWRDVMTTHQTQPFHCMIGGGDQIYMDSVTKNITTQFGKWAEGKHRETKHSASFTAEMQEELEQFYLDRYAMWFSTGMFGWANSQIPMINVWDDHDIIDVSLVTLGILDTLELMSYAGLRIISSSLPKYCSIYGSRCCGLQVLHALPTAKSAR